MGHGGAIVATLRLAHTQKNGTHPESSGNAPPTAARAHAWRGGYTHHAHLDSAAGPTYPPPTCMLIARPGAPPPHTHLHRPHRAGSTTCCSLPRRSARRGSGFSHHVQDPATTSTTATDTTITLRHHHAPAPSRPAPSRPGAITPGTITTLRGHHANHGDGEFCALPLRPWQRQRSLRQPHQPQQRP